MTGVTIELLVSVVPFSAHLNMCSLEDALQQDLSPAMQKKRLEQEKVPGRGRHELPKWDQLAAERKIHIIIAEPESCETRYSFQNELCG